MLALLWNGGAFLSFLIGLLLIFVVYRVLVMGLGLLTAERQGKVI